MIVLNAFSANMLGQFPANVNFTEVTLEQARAQGPFQSAVGHADTAAVFGSQLGTEIPFNRSTVSLQPGDRALLGQYQGPRLPEGATALPEGASIRWLLVEVLK